jgi:hypothetical protein
MKAVLNLKVAVAEDSRKEASAVAAEAALKKAALAAVITKAAAVDTVTVVDTATIINLSIFIQN